MPREEALALERALVTIGTRPAVLGAVASRYLAVGTPRSFAIIGAGAAADESLEAHRTWFDPHDLRATDARVAAAIGGRVVSLEEALAADIVCIHDTGTPLALSGSQLRRGTHVNALAAVELDEELVGVARLYSVTALAQMAAGLIDGRQLDEITVFVAARAMLPTVGS